MPKNNKLPVSKRRKIKQAVERYQGDGLPHTVQDSLPFEKIYPDGLCKLSETKYSRCIEFEDINFRLASEERQNTIIAWIKDLLHSFDPSVGVELTMMTRRVHPDTFRDRIELAARGDPFDDLRAVYSDMLRSQFERGSNKILQNRLLVLSVETSDVTDARDMLQRLAVDTLRRFQQIGSTAVLLDGKAWLEVLHHTLHPDGDRFRFNWRDLAHSGASQKDYVVPSSLRFGNMRAFQLGSKHCAASFLRIDATSLQDSVLTDLLDTESTMMVSLHFHGMEQQLAIKAAKRAASDMDSIKINSQKKAVREGYDMDIMSSDLRTYSDAANSIVGDLVNGNEKMFLVTILLVHMADSKRKLKTAVMHTEAAAAIHNCTLVPLDYLQEQGFLSALPLGHNEIQITRGLLSSALSIFVPFRTKELFQDGEAVYYGRNALSGNLILADPKRLRCPNALYLGMPGSGKSFAAKRSIVNFFLTTNDDILICDPEAEYYPLVEALSGQVIRISAASKQYVNPFDLNLNYSEEDNPLALKSEFILSFCEAAVGGQTGLSPVEKTLIDRAIRVIYQAYLADPKPEHVPILEDLYEEIQHQPEPEAKRLASSLELYVHGNLNVFNHRTNVDIRNRLVCFDIKELGNQLKKLGMLVIQDQIWNRVTQNRNIGKSTQYYVDEFHLLLQKEVASWSAEIWKRFRKWGGCPCGITQNPKSLLDSKEIENILDNSDFLYLLNMKPGDRRMICDRLDISPAQEKYIDNSAPGEGLLVFGDVILPFVDDFPKDNPLYQLMTTKLNEVVKGENNYEQ